MSSNEYECLYGQVNSEKAPTVRMHSTFHGFKSMHICASLKNKVIVTRFTIVYLPAYLPTYLLANHPSNKHFHTGIMP